jgi:hypothetical protein
LGNDFDGIILFNISFFGFRVIMKTNLGGSRREQHVLTESTNPCGYLISVSCVLQISKPSCTPAVLYNVWE